jgi:hypothetical protein
VSENETAGPDMNALFAEFARRQNPNLVRDNSPHQALIKTYWLSLKKTAGEPLAMDDVGMSVFSQNNEDGILLYLFSRIGFGTRRSIEIGCNIDNTTIGLPEGNSINLIVNFGFHGLIVDLEKSNVDGLRHFFSTCFATRHFHQAVDVRNRRTNGTFYSPILLAEEVSTDNINQIAGSHGFTGEIDLLSIDIDGEDIRLFDAVSVFSPRVVMIEVNNRLPFEERHFFGRLRDLDMPTVAHRQSFGASLAEVVAAAGKRDFVFVGMNNCLINAFFVRKDVFSGSGLKEAEVAEFAHHPLRPPESFALE